MKRKGVLKSGALAPRFFLWVILFLGEGTQASDFGPLGLIDMPTARMRSDGALTLSTSQQDTEDIYAVTFQALPRLEGTFRYTVQNPGDKLGSLESNRDRSFEAKWLLVKEGDGLPALAVGARDMLGTGVFSSEYMVASKRFGPIDLSLGLGWGRLAGRGSFSNPLVQLTDAAAVREGETGEGGVPRPQDFFRGEKAGVFGGIEIDLPQDLRFIAEFSSDRYTRETRLGTISEPSAFNFGLGWQPAQGLDVILSHQLGQDLAVSVSASLDALADVPEKPSAVFWSVDEGIGRRANVEGFAPDSWYAKLLFDVERSGLLLLSGDLRDRGRTAWLELENPGYAYEADALRRLLALAELHLPKSVRAVHVLLQQDGIVHARVRYLRRLGTPAALPGASSDLDSLLSFMPPRPMVPNPDFRTGFPKPFFNFGVSLGQRAMLMDPDDPLRYQFLAKLNLGADLGRDFYLRGSLGLNLYNDWNTIRRESDSVLPRVRSEIKRYLQEGDTGLDVLLLEKRGMMGAGIAYRAYAGVLEEMFSGVGGELLYRPFPSRLALGVNLNYARQRDFDKRFGLQDYEVITGHASLYWATPFYHYDVAVHGGRYLAGDWGGTLEVRRTFDNGWMVGGFFTLTDVPFDRFGEGSFDKGLFFRVPFNSLLPGNSREAFSTTVRTIQRDGGARLDGVETLWWESRSRRTDALVQTRRRMLPR
jgi:hypothetical protein